MDKKEHKIIDGIECKHCSKCGEWLPLSEFGVCSSRWDGLQHRCNKCNAIYRKQYRNENKDKLEKINDKNRERLRKWRKEHPDYHKKWKENNPMKRAALDRIHSHNQSDKENCRGEGNLTVEWYIENILTKSCVHCGETDWRKLGCNRLDNDKPHTIDNVECCCRSCNSKLANKELKTKQIDKIGPITGEVLASYPSAREAARILNIGQGNISACARGEKPIAYGYIWKYPL